MAESQLNDVRRQLSTVLQADDHSGLNFTDDMLY